MLRYRLLTLIGWLALALAAAIQSPDAAAEEPSLVVDDSSYTYNSANQRTRIDLADGSFWSYEYDSLGQLTNAVKYWFDGTAVPGQQFGYGFDDIGNRVFAVRNSQSELYSANPLNQYLQRTVPGIVWETGSASSNATVTINLEPVSRRSGVQLRPEISEYFWKEFTVDNRSQSVYTQLTTVAVLKNSGGDTNQPDILSASTGRVFVAQSPEVFRYDADGNLTNDSRWSYTWDAENRLVAVETDPSKVGETSVPRLKLEFGYDWRWRRTRKKLSVWNASSNQYLASSIQTYVYDGWNLLAEFSLLASPPSPLRSFTWGLDVSGTELGAGGSGGLLGVTVHGSPVTNYFAASDGNGNVTALVNAETGLPSARFEYGPFGEPVRVTGPAVDDGVFRFSSRQLDPETALVGYGLRFYSPGLGRWLNRDPIAEPGGLNLYGFVDNDPIGNVDLFGLFNLETHARLTSLANSRVASQCLPCECDPVKFLESMIRGSMSPDLQLNLPGGTGLLRPSALKIWNLVGRGEDFLRGTGVAQWGRHMEEDFKNGFFSVIPGGTDFWHWWNNTSIGGSVIQWGNDWQPDIFGDLYQTHYGDTAWEHSMSVAGMSAQQLQQQLVDGSMDLIHQYRQELNAHECEKAAFDLGKLLHYLQDSFTPSHALRENGGISSFLDYTKQSAGNHAKEDAPLMNSDFFSGALNGTIDLICLLNDPALSDDVIRLQLEQNFYRLNPGVTVGKPGPYEREYTRLPF